jgi:hypothetical protein
MQQLKGKSQTPTTEVPSNLNRTYGKKVEEEKKDYDSDSNDTASTI